VLKQYPSFSGNQQDQLLQFMDAHLHAGNGERVLDKVLKSRYAPSKKLLEHTSQVVLDQKAYVLLDSQQVVFAKVLAEVKEAASAGKRKKAVVLVHGGPGTGKSVVALHLLGRLSGEGFNTMHLTGSKAFTENMRKVVGTRASAQFGYFNVNKKGDLPPNQFDALVMDEAHRIRETSRDRFTRAEDWSGLPQVEELLHIARVCVFFIDDRQIVRPGEVGSSALIREAAKKAGANLHEYELDAQFRCRGSDGFINWVDNTLDVRRTANVLWKYDDPYEVRIVNSIQDLETEIRKKSAEGESSRLVAGFCWPWSDPNSDGSLVPDVKVGDWEMPWNARPDGKRLARGIPKSNFWASDSGGLEQVGCVYTAQGFEFDYVGIIFGLDLKYDWETNEWVGDKKQSFDTVVKRSGDQFVELVKNTYRVLFTRGIKGCYIHFMDEGTRRFFQSRME
jgi:ATP:corrinoid adenosyltransferase